MPITKNVVTTAVKAFYRHASNFANNMRYDTIYPISHLIEIFRY